MERFWFLQTVDYHDFMICYHIITRINCKVFDIKLTGNSLGLTKRYFYFAITFQNPENGFGYSIILRVEHIASHEKVRESTKFGK